MNTLRYRLVGHRARSNAALHAYAATLAVVGHPVQPRWDKARLAAVADDLALPLQWLLFALLLVSWYKVAIYG